MRRLFPPAVLAFTLALLASLAIHLPVYEVLGALAKYFRDKRDEMAYAPVEIEIGVSEDETDLPEPLRDETPTEPSESSDDQEDDALPAPPPPPEHRERLARRETPPPEEPREEEREVEVTPRPTPPPEAMNKQAIQQRSQNPNVQPPPDSQYIARENNVVEEETVARIRNYARDDEEQEVGEQSETAREELGNAEQQDIAEAREMEGSDARSPTEIEANADRPREAPDTPPPTVASRGNTGRIGNASEAAGDSTTSARGGSDSGQRARGGGERMRMIEINDGLGTFVVAVPEEGDGPGEGGGPRIDGEGLGTRGDGRRAGRVGRGRTGDGGRGRGVGVRGPDLRVSWAAFEEVYGEEQLREERETWIRERQSRLTGSNRERNWREFRAAIENYVEGVRPGNQTALNAAASPFAEYLAAVHRRIHQQFADGFLPGLPAGSSSPFNDPTLMTKLEIILNRDGTVDRIGVVKPSGFLPFDYGAYNAVMRAQPYPEAPTSILSGDGKVYVHWGFYRNERQCGTFNAEPYILPNPPGAPRRGSGGGLRDLESAPLVPREAEPTWGTQPSERPRPEEGEGAGQEGSRGGDEGTSQGRDGARGGADRENDSGDREPDGAGDGAGAGEGDGEGDGDGDGDGDGAGGGDGERDGDGGGGDGHGNERRPNERPRRRNDDGAPNDSMRDRRRAPPPAARDGVVG